MEHQGFRLLFPRQEKIYGIQCGKTGPIGLVQRQNAGSSSIFEKKWHLLNVAAIGILHDVMEIIKVESIVEMVGRHQRGKQQNGKQRKESRFRVHENAFVSYK